jgi:hypothetical protein
VREIMNEISILLQLLSRIQKDHQIGASEDEMLNILNYPGKNAKYYLNKLLVNLNSYIEPIGLQVKYNPINNHWFISSDSDISEKFASNPLEHRPGILTTLFCIVTCAMSNSGTCKLSDLMNLRKKKTIIEDLTILKEEKYIVMDDDAHEIELTPLLGYELDLNQLIQNIALKLEK